MGLDSKQESILKSERIEEISQLLRERNLLSILADYDDWIANPLNRFRVKIMSWHEAAQEAKKQPPITDPDLAAAITRRNLLLLGIPSATLAIVCGLAFKTSKN